jgi:alkylhydroperoxidase/carboxymuconolactone decarboxylase family protein YurZ
MTLSTQQQQIKDRFVAKTGYWCEGYEEWLKLDQESFAVFSEFARHPYGDGSLSDTETALIQLALASSVTHLNEDGIRRHVRQALDSDAEIVEIKEVFELVGGLGIHAMVEGIPILETVIEADDPDAHPDVDEKERVKALFKEERGYWSDFWDSVLKADHEFLEKYTHLTAYPWNDGELEPKLRELIYLAIDVSTTHLYTPGLEQHMVNAVEYGATKGEILTVIEIASQEGYDAMATGIPILVEEIEQRSSDSD